MPNVNPLARMNFVSVDEIPPGVMEYILRKSLQVKQQMTDESLLRLDNHTRRIGMAFCENSTRTRMSNEAAAHMAGFVPIGFGGSEGTSLTKKESLRDTLEMFSQYRCSAIVLRHALNGSASWAVETMQRSERGIPIINGGDGTHEHPTQLILDRFTVLELTGRLTDQCDHPYSTEGLVFLLAGDLKYGRVSHSLVKDFSKDGCHFIFATPDAFQMPQTYLDLIEKNGSTFEQCERLGEDVISRADIMSGYRFQLERYKNLVSSTAIENAMRACRYTLDDLEKYAKLGAKLIHPLPINRIDPEIEPAINDSRFNGYYGQAGNGVNTRYVELCIALGLIGEDFEGEIYSPPEQGEIWWKDRKPGSPGSENGFTIQPIRTSGTTIDRLPIDTADEVLRVLNLNDKGMIYRGANVRPRSKREKKKGILMIEDWTPSEEDLMRIGLIAGREEDAGKAMTVNFIEGGKVVRKVDLFAHKVVIVEGQGTCPEPNCISRPEHYEHAPTRVERAGPGFVRCKWCDTKFPASSLFM